MKLTENFSGTSSLGVGIPMAISKPTMRIMAISTAKSLKI